MPLRLACASRAAEFEGRILKRSPSLHIAMLEQEPQLDESSDVMSNVTDGLKEQKTALERFDEVIREIRLEPEHAAPHTMPY